MKNRLLNDLLALRRMILTTLIVLFFVTGIIIYYVMLSRETAKHITKIGELNAATSAEQIDSYFSAGEDTLRLVSFTLDSMLRSGSSESEILDYMKNESIAIKNITSGYCSGLYGYVGGAYADGTGWVPYAGYDPVQRPWYVEAEAGIGRVTVVGPYTDSETGKSIITLAKTLCDVRSVIALDFSMERLQAIAEDVTEHGDSYAEIVLDRDYQVIAHSDRAEVGKCYFKEEQTFGRALVDALRDAEAEYFSVRYDGAEYIVYMTEVAGEWFCLSVIDATEPFQALKRPMLVMITFAVCILLIQLYILIRAQKNKQLAEQLSDDLHQAEHDLSERDSRLGEITRIAYRDALTSVGSKSAFNKLADEIAEKRKSGDLPTAVVMMDVNNLKTVNDNCGHEAGDKYLKGCCQLICKVYAHSPVFRIGGDEFVAVLQGEDFANRDALLEQLNAACEAAYGREDAEPWEKFAIAAGMSVCEPEETAISEAFSRADMAMYDAKRAFKETH